MHAKTIIYMNMARKHVALFDLDGVILDSESGYTDFWNIIGEKFGLGKNFGLVIKGQTLVKILNEHFPNPTDAEYASRAIVEYEKNMPYEFIPGAEQFIDSLKKEGISCAIVTSSNKEKMDNVYLRHPELKEKFDHILTSEDFKKSKPSPECYLRAMEMFSVTPEEAVIFEDSICGLQSAKESGATVVGLSTTNSAETVAEYADYVISDFTGHSFLEFIR